MSIIISGVAFEDYFDDGGTAYGLVVDDNEQPVSVTIRSSVEPDDEGRAQREDHHTLHALAGKRLRITVEVLP